MLYTSPNTNKTYQIEESVHQRGAWDENGNYTPYEQSVFKIYENGRMVQFANCREDIARTVAHLENPGPDISSRFD